MPRPVLEWVVTRCVAALLLLWTARGIAAGVRPIIGGGAVVTQDDLELCFDAPIVSWSVGCDAVFLLGAL
jgi:hypothetical protein